MKASFNGARKNLVHAYNRTVRAFRNEDSYEAIDGFESMRQIIVGLLCMHDDSDPDDCDEMTEYCERLEQVGNP